MEIDGRICDRRTHGQVRRCREVKAAASAMWPKADPVRLVLGLLTDPQRLTRAVSALHVVHAEPLPQPLEDAVPSPR
jgi:hypothetical protein